MALSIREMTPADCDALAELDGDPALGIDPRVELGGRLTRAWVAAAAEGAPALGYALGWWVVDELQLLGIGVVPGARRQGVGRALLAHLVEATREACGRRVILEVAAHNTEARRLYESAGFTVFNVRAHYYAATGDDALEMELLTGA